MLYVWTVSPGDEDSLFIGLYDLDYCSERQQHPTPITTPQDRSAY